MYKNYIAFEVDKTIQRMLLSNHVKEEDFMKMIKSATQSLKCNENCVGPCALRMWTLEEKAECLHTCLCYDPPVVPELPPAPEAAPAEAAPAEAAALLSGEVSKNEITYESFMFPTFLMVIVGFAIWFAFVKITKKQEEKLLENY